MEFTLPQALEVLERTPAVLRAMLGGLSGGWVHAGGEETFSPYDVVGHLITGERTDHMARTHHILRHGSAAPFEKYDRYAQFERSRGKSMGELLDEFARLRRENLAALRGLGLSAADLAREGWHPALGRVTLQQLLATWATHDLNHIAQIAKLMAFQYEDEVGPWRAYMGVLQQRPAKMDADGVARKRAAGAVP
ncbi:MAG: DinB family protein [Phycisphaerales bacterium]